jgi:hypothetical protein
VLALRGCGLDITRVDGFDGLDRELRTLVGTECGVTVERDGDYLRVQVNEARPPDRRASGDTPDDDDDPPDF